MADFTITNDGAGYVATNSLGQTVATGANASVVSTAVLNLAYAGQTIAYVGAMVFPSTVIIRTNSLTLDFTQATLTVTFSGNVLQVHSEYVTIVGGDMDGGGYSSFMIVGGYGSSNLIVQESTIHGFGTTNYGAILLINNGYNGIINCHLLDDGQSIFVADTAHHTQILNNEFHTWSKGGLGHAIYLDGGAGAGYHIVSGNNFHDPNNGAGAGIVLKCGNCKIHNNEFTNFNSNVPISNYSQYTTAHADSNEIFDNTFTNCLNYVIWVGGNPDALNPVLGIKIYSNRFINCPADTILLNPWSASNAVVDAWIYYNTFVSCGNFLRVTSSSGNVANTVVAYNTFDKTITDLMFETAYTNTMVYGNTGLSDFNVPSPLPIPPPISVPSVTITATTAISIQVGQSVSFSANVTGGTSPYAVAWQPSGVGASVTIQFNSAGTFNVTAVATDADGVSSMPSNIIQVTVTGQPSQLVMTLTANPNSIQAGGTSAITANIKDGTGVAVMGASVAISVSGGLLTQNSGITDANGNFAATFTDAVVETVTISGNATKQGYNMGQATPITVIVINTGGTATISGTVRKNDGMPIALAVVAIDGLARTTGNDGSYTFEGVQAKTYQMTVTATGYQPWSYSVDASAGGTVTQNAVLTSTTPILANLGIIALGGAVVIYLATRKGKRGR